MRAPLFSFRPPPLQWPLERSLFNLPACGFTTSQRRGVPRWFGSRYRLSFCLLGPFPYSWSGPVPGATFAQLSSHSIRLDSTRRTFIIGRHNSPCRLETTGGLEHHLGLIGFDGRRPPICCDDLLASTSAPKLKPMLPPVRERGTSTLKSSLSDSAPPLDLVPLIRVPGGPKPRGWSERFVCQPERSVKTARLIHVYNWRWR